MIPGNCLIGAVAIWLIHGGTIIVRTRPASRVPHWMVVCRDGRLRHFTVRREILPRPFGYFLFLGYVETK